MAAVIRLRIFHRDEPAAQIDSRTLDEGDVSIGRGAKADWTIDDPERTISRTHLVVSAHGGLLTVRDTSANGVFLGQPRQRLERERAVPVSRGELIQFGPYIVIAEEEDRRSSDAEDQAATDPSPFGLPAGIEAEEERAPPKRRDPFGSAMKPDPVALDTPPSADGGDAWEQRPTFEAGGWDPVPPHLRTDHSKLIGTEQHWAEPSEPVETGLGFDAPFTKPILHQPAIGASDVAIPSNWDAVQDAPLAPPAATPSPPAAPAVATQPDPAPSMPAGADAMLFERFCAGARLSPDAFAGEDRGAMMERLGAVYRQSILGISDLMSERSALKNDYRMARTTIRPDANNPFKWVPAQRIAVELLLSDGASGYSTGERALNDALHDLKAHMLCLLAGMRAALAATFDLLAPSEIEKRVSGRGFLIRAQRDAAAWGDYTELFATMRREADDSAEGPINKAFRQAYERQLRELDGGIR